VAALATVLSVSPVASLSLIKKLQENHSQLATIIVSAYGDIANIRTAMNGGAFDFLMKPIDFADLETTIAKTIRHVEALREARRRQLAAERAHASLSRYFSPNLAERLAADPASLELAGRRREVASLFTDIAGFTALVETLNPSVLASLLNEYLTGMTNVVFAHEGTVAKIAGDAIHVLFGAPGEQPDHCERAITCALALDSWAEPFRKQWTKKGISLGLTRIGVHAGPAIVGNFGGGRLFDYTAYGDTISVAARLEAANKPLGIRISVSSGIAAHVPNFRGRPIGDLILRGRSEPLRVFEPVLRDVYDDAALAGYLMAYAKLESGDPRALAAFAAQITAKPDDQLASFHLRRLLNGEKGSRIEMK
jgi:adenylate cyclase